MFLEIRLNFTPLFAALNVIECSWTLNAEANHLHKRSILMMSALLMSMHGANMMSMWNPQGWELQSHLWNPTRGRKKQLDAEICADTFGEGCAHQQQQRSVRNNQMLYSPLADRRKAMPTTRTEKTNTGRRWRTSRSIKPSHSETSFMQMALANCTSSVTAPLWWPRSCNSTSSETWAWHFLLLLYNPPSIPRRLRHSVLWNH